MCLFPSTESLQALKASALWFNYCSCVIKTVTMSTFIINLLFSFIFFIHFPEILMMLYSNPILFFFFGRVMVAGFFKISFSNWMVKINSHCKNKMKERKKKKGREGGRGRKEGERKRKDKESKRCGGFFYT